MQDLDKIFEIPECVVERILELKALVEKHQLYIPTQEAAKFLRVAPTSLYSFIHEHPEFAMGWRKDGKAHRSFNIPSAKFYLWYMNLNGFNIFVAQERKEQRERENQSW